MSNILRYLGQGVIYALIAALFGVFATWPSFRHFEDDKARLTLSIAHSAKHVSECRRLTAAEIAALPANMRRPLDCPRERLPVLVEVDLDGETIVSESSPPSGLFGDGPSQIYRNFTIPSGRHSLAVRLRDSARSEGFDYIHEATVEIRPRQRLVIEFRAEAGGFRLSEAAVPGASSAQIAGAWPCPWSNGATNSAPASPMWITSTRP